MIIVFLGNSQVSHGRFTACHPKIITIQSMKGRDKLEIIKIKTEQTSSPPKIINSQNQNSEKILLPEISNLNYFMEVE
jgi:hypothetical protein